MASIGGGVNVGSAYITIIPSFKGGVKSITSQLSGVDGSKAGASVGKSFSSGLSDAVGKGAGKVAKALSANKATGSFSRIATSAANTSRNAVAAFAPVGASISSGINSAASGTLSAFGRITAGAVTAGAAVTAVLGAGLAKVAPMATSASDTLKRFESTMSFAGYDNSAISQAKADMQAYADSSVYDLSDVMNTAAQLGANGVQSFDKITQALGNVNMAAGGNAESFHLAAQQLVQMNAAGKVTYADWKIFAQDMPGGAQKIKDELASMGAYQGDFNDALSNGQISSEEFNKALMNLGFTDVAVQAANSSTTVESAMGQIEASVEKAGQTIFDDLVSSGSIQTFTTTVTGAIDSAVPKIEAFAQDVAGKVGQVRDAVVGSGIIDSVKEFASAFVEGFSGSGQDFGAFCDALKDGLTEASGALREAMPYVRQFGQVLGESLPKIAEAAPKILAAAVAIKVMGSAFKVASSAAKGIATLKTAVGTFRQLQYAGKVASSAGGAIADVGKKSAVAAGGLSKAGSASSVSCGQMLSFAVAAVAVGAGILLASVGLSLMADAATRVAAAGPLAVASLVIMAVSVAALALVFAQLGPQLTAGSVGMIAFGAAVALVGAGVMLASVGITMLIGALPTLVAYGTTAASTALTLSGSMTALGVSLLVAGAGALVAGAGLVVLAAGALLAGAGLLVLGAGASVAFAGAAMLSAVLPMVCTYVTMLAATAMVAGAGALVLGAGLLVAGAGAMVAFAGFTLLSGGLMLVAAGATLAAGGITLLSGWMAALSAGVNAAAGGMRVIGDAMPAISDSAGGAASGMTEFSVACVAASAGIGATTPAVQGFSGAAGTAQGAASNMASGMQGATGAAAVLMAAVIAAGSAASSASGGFNVFRASAESSARAAQSAVLSACRAIQSSVNGLNLTIPTIRVSALPHFSMSGTFNAETGEVPTVSVSYYAAGALFTHASVFGEAGPEAALPLTDRVLGGIGSGIAETMDTGSGGDIYNLYLNGLRFNDDAQIEADARKLLIDLRRKAAM